MDADLLPCGAVRIAADRTVLHANRHALTLLAADGETVIGRNVVELVSPATRILLDSYVYPMLLETGVAEEIQLTLRSAAGRAHPIVANFRMNADGTVDWAFMGCANRDQLYTELLDTRDELEDRTRALGRLNTRIRERQADLQAFCHSLSHDFTGPLLLVRRFVGLALEDLRERGVDVPDELSMLERAERNAEVLVAMADGLVEYLVADTAASDDERVDLDDVVTAVLGLREDDGATRVTVHRADLPTVVGSRAQLQVLFKNLVDNAIKYNDREPEITIGHRPDAASGRVVVSVRDNGIGMSGAQLDRAFDPFVRLHVDGARPGSGLGLSIARKMVANHGGDIRVESAPGVGSTFHVTLPLEASG